MAIALSAAPGRVTGSAARSQTSAVAPPAARRSTPESSNAPHGAQASPRRVNAAAAASTCSRCGGQQEPEARERHEPVRQRDAGRAGEALEVERRAAAVGQLEHLQQRPGDAGHRDVARGAAEAGLGDLDERLAVVAQALGRAVAQRREDRDPGRVAPAAVEAEGGEQRVARAGVGGAEQGAGGPGAGGRQRGRAVRDREVPADDGDAEQAGRPRQPVEHALRVRAVGADERVDERERAAAHRADVGDVRRDRGRARGERVALEQLGRDRLGAHEQEAVPLRDRGRVVAVERRPPPGSRSSRSRSCLARRPGADAHERGEGGQFGGIGGGGRHDGRIQPMSTRVFQRVAAVNVGLDGFAAAVREQGADVVDVDWRPPAGGDAATLALLEALWGRHGERVERGQRGRGRSLEGVRPRALTVARAGRRDRRSRRRRAPALGAADRLGRRVRPAAAGAARRVPARGLGRRPRRRRAPARRRRGPPRERQRARPRRAR